MDSYDNMSVLIVEPPSQVRFRGPFNRPALSKISLINPTDKKIIFKIKTSAPGFYGVRPNFGVVQPRNFTEIEIARQPFKYDPKEKITDRFLIQSLAAPSEVEDINEFWRNANTALLVSSKLRCVFEMPTESSRLREEKKLRISDAPIDLKEMLHQRQIESINLELREMRTENNLLRNENAILKNEILQIRSSHQASVQSTIVKGTRPFSLLYILVSVLLVLICIFIAKYLI